MSDTLTDNLPFVGVAQNDEALQILKRTFGYNQFRGQQAEIIHQVLNGGDALAIMPTGGGKSLCYQIPALVRKGTAVVISPLISLMKDQVDALQQNDVRAAYLNSSLSAKKAAAAEKAFVNGDLDLLYIAPERLLSERALSLVARAQIALFAIDEAHCVSQWGHDFRRDYLNLGRLAELFPNVPRLALTATADARTRAEIIDKLGMQNAKLFVASFDRPNIRFAVTLRENARRQLLDFYQRHHQGQSGIIYCMSRRKTEEMAQFLEQQGLRALPYHAGIDKKTRENNQEIFTKEEGVIITATIAFGMGINKPDVRFVAHADMPKSIESYYQEIGRAGRDGLRADALLLYGTGDAIMIRQMIEEGDAPEYVRRIERQKVDALLAFCESVGCRRSMLLSGLGETYESPCNNCDNCESPPQTWEGDEAAKKFLSCVARTKQTFGAGHIVDVLLGKESEKAQRFGHTTISTFGIGGEFSEKEWRAIARQLVAANALKPDAHGALQLTDDAWAIMRGDKNISFRREAPRPPRARKKAMTTVKPAADLDARQMEAFEAMRVLRKKLAQTAGIPAYAIFHDSVLVELARLRPQTGEEFGEIPGVGRAKLARYSSKFIKVLRDY